MARCNPVYFLLCYVRFSPPILEITNLFLSIFVGLFTIIGHPKIPFYIDSKIYKIIFFFNVPYLIIIMILNIIFLVFRSYHLMNDSLNIWGYGLSVLEIYVALFGIITNMINDSIIVSNINYYQDISLKKKTKKYRLITAEELLYTKIILPFILFLWINIIFVSLTDNLLINMKISASYYTYELAMEDERNFAKEQNNNKNEENDSENNNNQNIMNNSENTTEISQNVVFDNNKNTDGDNNIINKKKNKLKDSINPLKDDNDEIKNNKIDKNLNQNNSEDNNKDISVEINDIYSSVKVLNMKEKLSENEEQKY